MIVTSCEPRWTYRFLKKGRACETHRPSELEALQLALHHIENDQATPIHIRQGRRVVYEQDDIFEKWAEKYL